ncbi:MAG: YgiQ family radical SAM protein [Clostridia bacterium]
MSFLPIFASEVSGQLDIVYVIGEAYCDHPSFGHAIVSRVIEANGLTIALIPQPQNDEDYCRFGAPRIGFFVSSGVVDSMVNNYTVAKIRRPKDVYSEGGDMGKRPDRCVDVYCRALKRLFPSSPIVIGGIEASLRRFAHYDYWADKVLPSILESSGADLLIYGMGEKPLKEICDCVKKGIPLEKIRDVRGTCYLENFENLSSKLKKEIDEQQAVFCPSFDNVASDKIQYVNAFNLQTKYNDHIHGKIMLQKQSEKYLVQNLMQLPLTTQELDDVYSLPYERNYHPSYLRGVPAIDEVKYSITSVRGCFGNCNYCAITYHQGRVVQKRSKENILAEGKILTQDKDFKGYIHDLGGPTANFRDPACKKQLEHGVCADKKCIGWKACPNMEVSHEEYLDILKALRELEGVKKVFIRSGIRFDYLMLDKSDEFLTELIKHHVSGQLKVAPEHVSDTVLQAMNKPSFDVYEQFKAKFDTINQKLGMKQYLVPYLISSHPCCTLDDAINLALYLKSIGYMPEQVQDFYPTPSTRSTCMYYTEINPDTMQKIYVAKSKKEKMFQRALMQYRKKSNYEIVKEALLEAGRGDLVGFGQECLIKPTHDEALEKSLSDKGIEHRSSLFRGARENARDGRANLQNNQKSLQKSTYNDNQNGVKYVKTRNGVVRVDKPIEGAPKNSPYGMHKKGKKR